jgi:putative membrane protein
MFLLLLLGIVAGCEPGRLSSPCPVHEKSIELGRLGNQERNVVIEVNMRVRPRYCAEWLLRSLPSLLISGLLLLPGNAQLLAAQANEAGARPQNASLSRSDKNFLRDAAEENQAAIELGQLAEQKGFSAAAKNFARSLVAERSRAQQELLSVAHRVHFALPLHLSRRDRKAKEQLEKHSGPRLDRLFLARMAADLDRQYGSYEDTAMSTHNSAVKDYIENLLSDVKHQDQMAKEIAPVGETNSNSQQ